MVSDKIISRYSDGLPASSGADRKIPGGPLYPHEDVLKILKTGDRSIQAWTRKCIADLAKLELDGEDLVNFLEEAVAKGRFLGAEWCQASPGGPWAACDAYSLIRREWMAVARKEMDMEYYVKFAIGKTGSIFLLVSCHPSEERRSP